jgi:hypothetical protein
MEESGDRRIGAFKQGFEGRSAPCRFRFESIIGVGADALSDLP